MAIGIGQLATAFKRMITSALQDCIEPTEVSAYTNLITLRFMGINRNHLPLNIQS